MPRPVPLAERAMEVQVAVDDLWTACVTARDYVLLSDAKALRDYARSMRVIARRMAGRAERLEGCADGLFGPAHGRAS